MDYKKFFIIIILLSLLLLDKNTYGQSATTAYTPKIVPPSPNAASIAKFGDIPVSTYTGTTDISIPVYTIQAKGVSVPITLDYHTGGIRLSEEAGWVGLGWALNMGGMISRSINDKDDFETGYFNSSIAQPMPEAKGRLVPHTLYPTQEYLGNWGYDFACNYRVRTELGDVDYYDAFRQAFSAPGTYDLEPDSYSFNFLGRSGKFIIARDRKVVLQKQENLKIEFAIDGSSFTITDEQGNKFYFLDKEYSQPTIGGAAHISAWMLSKIVTQQNDVVTFNYSSDNTWSTVKGITSETLRIGVAGYETPIYSNDPGHDYFNLTLKNIDYTNCQVQFSFDADRIDLQGGKKLNKIKIYSKNQDGLTYLKEERLYYSYFEGLENSYEFQRLRLDSVKEISGSMPLPPYSFTYNMPPNNQGLLGKHYSSVDHWGFFNAKSNAVYGNNTLGFTPGFAGIVTLNSVSQYINLPGANREPDFTYMQAFSLNRVNYPTGGYTLLEYEPNDYDYDNSISGREGRDFDNVTLVTKTISVVVNSAGTSTGTVSFPDIYETSNYTSNASINIGFRAASSASLNNYHNTLLYGKINFTFQNDATDITDTALQCSGTKTGNNCSGNVYGTSRALVISSRSAYTWSAYIDPQVLIPGGFMEITVTFTYYAASYTQATKLIGGGLRIKSIKDYDAVTGKLAKKRTYDYGYQQDKDGDGVNESYSYGRLMGYLSYARNELFPTQDITGHTIFHTSFTRYSSSFSAFTSLSSGNIVGYDQVTEYTIDSASGKNNGKTVYTYNNSSDTSFSYAGYRLPGVLNLPNNLNGLPKSKSVFANAGFIYRKISSSNYYYRSANRIIYDAFKYTHVSGTQRDDPAISVCSQGEDYAVGACSCPLDIDSTGYEATANFYPAISSEVVLLDSTVETMYDQNDTTIQLNTITRNYYDNPKHYQLTRTSVTDSRGNKHVSFIKYPQDYLPGVGGLIGNTVLDSMIKKNIISAPIEKSDSLYLSGSSSGLISGAQASIYKLLSPDKVIALNKQYKLDVPSPVTDFQPMSFSGNTINKDSRYRQMISFDSYNTNNDIQQYTGTDQMPVSFIWDYSNMYPIAQTKNAAQSDIAYTSFETDGSGNWNIPSATRNHITAVTGSSSYNIANGTIKNTNPLDTNKRYIISLWAKTLPAISHAVLQKTGRTFKSFVYYEFRSNAKATSVVVSGSGLIDELRLYPDDAQMITYAYQPLIGLSSQCDANNNIAYYEYDVLGRLVTIRDADQNIIKKYAYNYAHQRFTPNKFYNNMVAKTYAKNDCTQTDYSGSEVTDTVYAATYTSDSSQDEADSLAGAFLSANGQTHANISGTCLPLMNIILANYSHISGFTIRLTSTYDSTKVYTIAFPDDSDSAVSPQKIPQGTYNVDINKADNTDSYVFTISGPFGDIQINNFQGSWVNVPIYISTFYKIAIGLLQ